MPDQKSLFDSDEDLAAWLARMTGQTGPQGFRGQASLAPGVQATIAGQGGSQPGGSAGLTMGPLSLNGGVNFQDGRAVPSFGAGMTVPLAGGDPRHSDASASAKFNITPGQMKEIELAYRRKLLGGDLSVGGNYSQPDQGTPNWGANLRWQRKF